MTDYNPLTIGLTADGRFDPRLFAHQALQQDEAYADAKQTYDTLHAMREPMLAKLINEARAGDPKMSNAQAEYLAKASDAYLGHLLGEVEAERAMVMALARTKNIERLHFGLMALERTRQAEIMSGLREEQKR